MASSVQASLVRAKMERVFDHVGILNPQEADTKHCEDTRLYYFHPWRWYKGTLESIPTILMWCSSLILRTQQEAKTQETPYTHSKLDHEELFEIASRLRGDFLMTYDDVDAVRLLAQRYGFDTQTVPMKTTHHTKMTELTLGPNLEWLRQPIEYCP